MKLIKVNRTYFLSDALLLANSVSAVFEEYIIARTQANKTRQKLLFQI